MELKSNTPLPPLRRDLEAFPIEHEGKPMFLLRDLEGLSDKSMALSPGGMAMAALLDGRHTVLDLQSLFAKHSGTVLRLDEIQGIVTELERSGLLETQEVQNQRQQILEDFLKSPVRKPALENSVYPKNLLELSSFFGKFFRDPKGPGKPLPEIPQTAQPPIGLVSPHIDFERGGPAYAWAYGTLAESKPPDLIVALGTAHMSPNSPWIMTRKTYETTYGTLETSLELYEEIKNQLWYDPLADEWVHRREHSLEPQAVWLKFIWREKTPPWLPVLCSAFDRFCPDRSPSTVPAVEEALQKIGERLAELSKTKRIMILSAVDLAHVGPRFGDKLELGPELFKRVEAADRRSLDEALKLDADAFYLSVVEGGHWRKVCGLSAFYTGLRWMKCIAGDKPQPGRLLSYGQAPDPLGGIVSFASAVYPRT
jgi:AmmeMemoRadiSam system protein B